MKRFTIFVLIGFVAFFYAAGCQDEDVNGPGMAGSTFAAMRVDMPEATSYNGSFGITLEFEEPNSQIFKPDLLTLSDTARLTKPDSKAFIAAKQGRFDAKLFPNLQWISNDDEQEAAVKALDKLDYDEFANQYDANKYLVLYRIHSGAMVYDFVDWVAPQPELFVLEEYRLTSHLGDYGTGRIISTLSLLPGETTEYQIHNFSSISELDASSSSIFDSRSEESAESFQKSVMSEESNLDKSNKSFQASASVSASAGWGWGKASVSASSKYSSNSLREEFARNVSSAVSNHASSASANRSVEVNNASTREREKEDDVFITKKVANPNLSHTLNFIFYQMNQEYITFLHLVDVSVGLLDANGNIMIVPVYDLQSLLDRAVLESAHEKVRERIYGMLQGIRDYKGNTVTEFLVVGNGSNAGTRDLDKEDPGFPLYRVDPRYESIYAEAGGRTIYVPGIIISVDMIVLRTDGVYVDILLGRNSALADAQDQTAAAELWQIQHATKKN